MTVKTIKKQKHFLICKLLNLRKAINKTAEQNYHKYQNRNA